MSTLQDIPTPAAAAARHELAHEPFDDREQQRAAATLGMWVFLGTELLLFGGMIGAYTVYRTLYTDAWIEGSKHLYEWIGVGNTAILLTSSLCAALAVRASEKGQRRALEISIALTILFGGAFLALKGVEYYLDITSEHLLVGYNFQQYHGTEPNAGHVALFLCFYWTMTAVHAVHMTIGLSVWTVLLIRAHVGSLPDESSDIVEVFAMYWHFVDLVWIFLLPLLYLVR